MLRLSLLFCALATQLHGLEIPDPSEVKYIHLQARGTPGGSVTLDCGPAPPTIYVWAYSGGGGGEAAAVAAADESVALVYDYGHGAKIQTRAHPSAQMSVQPNSSTLLLTELQAEARGTYTCQALYDGEDGARITFYVTRLYVGKEED